MECLSAPMCKSHTQVLESIISIVLAVELDFSQHSTNFLPLLLDFLRIPSGFDWSVRKMAIDVLYTFAAILKQSMAPFKSEVLEILAETRTDKIKPVREASIEAIQAFRELPNVEVEERIPGCRSMTAPYNGKQ